jgi:hypothetical protein
MGFNLAIDKGVAHLKAKGDSDLIVSQVMMKFATKNEKLKRYRDLAQSLSNTMPRDNSNKYKKSSPKDVPLSLSLLQLQLRNMSRNEQVCVSK